jgi:hypothetical protein
VFELAGHFDISIGLTVMLMADPQSGQVGRDRTSFFIFPRSEFAPVVYDYALMRLDEFVASRVVEAVVHGMDLTDALGREPMATPEGVAIAAGLSTTCSPARRSRDARGTWRTTWPGSGPRREGPSIPTLACR